MSITLPHLRSSGNVLVKEYVIVDDGLDPGESVVGTSSTPSSTLVNDGLVSFYSASDTASYPYDDPSQNQLQWINTLPGTANYGSGVFIFPENRDPPNATQAANLGFIESNEIGIVTHPDISKPRYLYHRGGKNGGQTLPNTFSWELIIWPVGTVSSAPSSIISHSSGIVNVIWKTDKNLAIQLGGSFQTPSETFSTTINLDDFAVSQCWHHLLLCWDNGNLRLYWDGNEVINLNTSIPPNLYNSGTLQISSYNVPVRRFAGNYALVRLYDTALSSGEVIQNYNYFNPTYIFGGDFENVPHMNTW